MYNYELSQKNTIECVHIFSRTETVRIHSKQFNPFYQKQVQVANILRLFHHICQNLAIEMQLLV